MTDTIERTALADAPSFEEHKRLRSSPQPDVKPADPPAESVKPASESASDSESDKEKSTREKSESPAQKRIRELNDKWRAADEERAALKREVEELRKGSRAPVDSKPAEQPKPEAAKPTEDEPDFEALYQAAIKDPANTTWEKANAAALKEYNKAVREHDRKTRDAEQKKAEADKQAEGARTVAEEKRAKALEKFTDFDETIRSFDAPDIKFNQGIQDALNASDSFDVLYHLAKNVDEMRRISALPPQQAYRAVVALELKLSSDATPEQPKPKPAPPVSRAPAPPAAVRSTTSHSERHPRDAGSMDEYRRLRKGAA